MRMMWRAYSECAACLARDEIALATSLSNLAARRRTRRRSLAHRLNVCHNPAKKLVGLLSEKRLLRSMMRPRTSLRYAF